jgi:hypothetical protein
MEVTPFKFEISTGEERTHVAMKLLEENWLIFPWKRMVIPVSNRI